MPESHSPHRARLRCTHCNQDMQALTLEGHYGNPQQVDLCPRCHLVWFDAFESMRLSGLGWAALLRAMHAAMAQSPGTLAPTLACVRCQATLKPVHNLTRFGRTAAFECPRKHGHYQGFSLLLAERGLVRPLLPGDRQALDRESRPLCCLNCGAASGAVRSDACAHCASPLVVFDLPRLMSSLLIRDAIPVPVERARHVSWACRSCGAAVDPTRMPQCVQCSHAVVAPSLADVVSLLGPVEAILRHHKAPARRPHGERLRDRSYRDTGFYRVVRTYLGGVPGAARPDEHKGGEGLPPDVPRSAAFLAAMVLLAVFAALLVARCAR